MNWNQFISTKIGFSKICSSGNDPKCSSPFFLIKFYIKRISVKKNPQNKYVTWWWMAQFSFFIILAFPLCYYVNIFWYKCILKICVTKYILRENSRISRSILYNSGKKKSRITRWHDDRQLSKLSIDQYFIFHFDSFFFSFFNNITVVQDENKHLR